MNTDDTTAIVIVGVPRPGKSMIARRVSQELGLTYLPADAIVSTLGRLHPDLGITHWTEDIAAVSPRLSPVVVELIRHMRFEGVGLVLDAYQCFPADLAHAVKSAPTEAAPSLVVGVGYADLHVPDKVTAIRRHAAPGDWTENLSHAELARLVRRFVAESERFRSETRVLGSPFFNTGAGSAFDRAVDEAIRGIVRRMTDTAGS
jgi:hypothetical protein